MKRVQLPSTAVATPEAPLEWLDCDPPSTARRLHSRGWLSRRLLVLADIAGLTAAFLFAAILVGAPSHELLSETAVFLLTVPIWVMLAKLNDLYDRDENRIDISTVDDVGRVLQTMTLGAWISTIGLLATGELERLRVVRVIWFWVLAVALVVIARALVRLIVRRLPGFQQNTIIVGAGDVGQQLARNLLRHPDYGIRFLGFVDADPLQRRPDLGELNLLGGPGDIDRLVRTLDVERVIFAFSNDDHTDILALIRRIRDLNVQVDVVPRLFDLISADARMHSAEGIPLVGLSRMRLSRSSHILKRGLDVMAATGGLLLISPLIVLIAVWIKIDSRGPVFFRQTRVGQHGEPFEVFKFRTMVRDADSLKRELEHLNRHAQLDGDTRMFKIERDPRITRAGSALRSCFIDELPQLINVLRGEMSLIGPRPLVIEEAQHVDSWGVRRLDLKPGITGLWQTLGHSDISFEEMVRLDYVYVTTWSLGKDLRLLLRTLPLVLLRKGR